MSLIRPEVQQGLWRAREVIAAGAGLAVGLWLMAQGGYLLIPLGGVLAALSLMLGLLAWRRLRFAKAGDGPGIVTVDEGQIAFFGPDTGGFVALRELAELRLVTLRGMAHWRLRQTDGQTLLIPVAAQGAAALFDAFASLPGLDSGALVAALEARPAPPPGNGLPVVADLAPGVLIWRRGTIALG